MPEPLAESDMSGNDHRDVLGRRVRELWVAWAQRQEKPKPSWLVSYDELSEADKEADRCIGSALWGDGFAQGVDAVPPTFKPGQEYRLAFVAHADGDRHVATGTVVKLVGPPFAEQDGDGIHVATDEGGYIVLGIDGTFPWNVELGISQGEVVAASEAVESQSAVHVADDDVTERALRPEGAPSPE